MEIFSEKNIKFLLLAVATLVFLSLFFTEAILFQTESFANEKKVIRQKNERGYIKNNKPKRIERLSEINGPRINEEAASISFSENKKTIPENKSHTLPKKIWVFLLVAYTGLLIFNLSIDFKKQQRIRWVWETVMTAIFIIIWNSFDYNSENIWFPFYILKIGLLIYFLYLYFFTKNNIPYKKINSQ